MSEYPEAVEGYVAYEQPATEPTLKEPHEVERLAMNLLGAAAEARAQSMAREALTDMGVDVDGEIPIGTSIKHQADVDQLVDAELNAAD